MSQPLVQAPASGPDQKLRQTLGSPLSPFHPVALASLLVHGHQRGICGPCPPLGPSERGRGSTEPHHLGPLDAPRSSTVSPPWSSDPFYSDHHVTLGLLTTALRGRKHPHRTSTQGLAGQRAEPRPGRGQRSPRGGTSHPPPRLSLGVPTSEAKPHHAAGPESGRRRRRPGGLTSG